MIDGVSEKNETDKRDRLQKKYSDRELFRRLLGYTRLHWKIFTVALVLMFLGALLEIFQPIVLLVAIDDIIIPGNVSVLDIIEVAPETCYGVRPLWVPLRVKEFSIMDDLPYDFLVEGTIRIDNPAAIDQDFTLSDVLNDSAATAETIDCGGVSTVPAGCFVEGT